MPYAVYRAPDVRQQGDVLTSLWSRNLQMRGQARDKYHWYYLGNPLMDADAFILTHEDPASSSSEPVGCCGAGVRLMMVDGREVRAGLLADFAVDKPHRTVMPAVLLQRALCAHVTSTYDFAYGLPNGAAVGIFQRVGFPLLGQMGRFVKVLRFAHFLRRRVSPRLAVPVGAIVDGLSALRDRIKVPSTSQFAWVDDVDERFDRLWELVRYRYPIIGERTSRFLRWRFVTRPGLTSRIAVLQRRNGDLLAYAAIVEKEPGVALVADFIAATDDDLRILLRRLSPALRRLGFHSAVILFLGTPTIANLVKAEGFRFRNRSKFVVIGTAATANPEVHCATPPPRERAAVDERRLARTEDWYLTEADRDN